jgi:multidrug efflux system outer membrane protein
LFPSLTLGLTGGFQATGLPLLSAPTSYWGLGPLAAVFNLFDGGRRRAQVDMREAEYREITADYRQTVLDAFREVEDSLARSTALQRQERELSEAARAASRTEALALDRYRNGASDFLDVVTAQTAALDAQQAYIDAQAQRRREAVTLVRALGGGVQLLQLGAALPPGTAARPIRR